MFIRNKINIVLFVFGSFYSSEKQEFTNSPLYELPSQSLNDDASCILVCLKCLKDLHRYALGSIVFIEDKEGTRYPMHQECRDASQIKAKESGVSIKELLLESSSHSAGDRAEKSVVGLMAVAVEKPKPTLRYSKPA